jgi:hypothetical protein
MTGRAFAFNDREFAFEVFDDEVVVLNLASGTYYALGGCAHETWSALVGSNPLADVVAAVEARYGDSAATVANDLTSLVDTLTAERIIQEAPAAGAAIAISGAGGGYQPPSFEKHSDMEQLLTLDPIHDVDPQKGWPHY